MSDSSYGVTCCPNMSNQISSSGIKDRRVAVSCAYPASYVRPGFKVCKLISIDMADVVATGEPVTGEPNDASV